MDPVSYRFHNADIAEIASVAAAPCTRLHHASPRSYAFYASCRVRRQPWPLEEFLKPLEMTQAAASGELWPVVYRKLMLLDSAQRLDDLAAVPGNRFEALAGQTRRAALLLRSAHTRTPNRRW